MPLRRRAAWFGPRPSPISSPVILTYMRAFRLGDRVQIADTVGDVVEVSSLVTRIRTIKNVEIPIANSMIQTIIFPRDIVPLRSGWNWGRTLMGSGRCGETRWELVRARELLIESRNLSRPVTRSPRLAQAELAHVVRINLQGLHRWHIKSLLLNKAMPYVPGLRRSPENRTVINAALA